jgi:hypothetical protein
VFGYPEKGTLISFLHLPNQTSILLTVYLRDILGRRKQVLTETFYFAKHRDIPPDSESIPDQDASESDDLIEFLRANDLERLVQSNVNYLGHNLMSISGHVFEESTLPKVQNVAVNDSVQVPDVSAAVTKELPPTPVTPQNPNSSSLPAQPVSSGSGRMVTRVSSGAIRHKSVGELLGEKDVNFLRFDILDLVLIVLSTLPNTLQLDQMIRPIEVLPHLTPWLPVFKKRRRSKKL